MTFKTQAAPLEANSSQHVVAFFESGAELCLAVSNFVKEGFNNSEKVIIIFSETHLGAIEENLRNEVGDLTPYRDSGQYVSYKAELVLPTIFKNGTLDRSLAEALIKQSLSEGGFPFQGIRLSGEMVRMLWDLGYPEATLCLEDFWNEALTNYPAKLFCPYLSPQCSDISKRINRAKISEKHDHVSFTRNGEKLWI